MERLRIILRYTMESFESKTPSAQMEVLRIPASMIRKSDKFLAQKGRTKKNLRCVLDEHLCEECRFLLREIFKSPRIAQRLWTTSRELHKQATASCPMCMQLYARARASDGLNHIESVSPSHTPFLFQVSGRSPWGNVVSFTYFDMIAATNEQDVISVPYRHAPNWSQGSVVLFSYLESSTCLNLVSKWFHDCVTNHVNCRRVADDRPLRLIDVSRVSSPSSVSLRKSSDIMMQESALRYVALSYCWGGPECNHLLTTKQTLPLREDCILLEDMPATLRDAVIVTRSCGLRYLWIDALCIRQDDQDEWSHEAARMGNIYAGALFVISAMSAFDSAQGLLHEKPRSSYSLGTICGESSVPDKHCQLLLRRLPLQLDDSLVCEPLSSRAWAYQERVLAPAVLHFGSDQLIWVCQSLERADSGWGYTRKGSREALDLDWKDILHEYSGCKITYLEDRLVALAGIAASMRRSSRYSGRYVAGMWENDLSKQLLFEYIYINYDPAVRKRTDVPTWSWAHLDGQQIYWPGGNSSECPFTVALLKSPVFHFATDEEDLRSLSAKYTISSCKVKLTGYVQSFRNWENEVRSQNRFRVESTSSMSLQRRHRRFHSVRYPFTSMRELFSSRRTSLFTALDDQDESKEREKLWNGFYALRMATIEGEGRIEIHYLVLDEIKNHANTSGRIFRRVGYMYLDKPSFSKYTDDPRKDIVDPQGYPFLTDAQVVDVTLI